MKSRPLTCPKCQAGPLQIEAIKWKGKLMCPECDCILKERKTPLYVLCAIGGILLGGVSIAATVGVTLGKSQPSWIAVVTILGGFSALLFLVQMMSNRLVQFEITDGHPHCRVCGYDLFAVESGICPECGVGAFNGKRAKV